jgi:uncharacterized protein YueI
MPKNMDDYLQEGIYGSKQTKPDERRLFLGSLRERAAFVLTQEQVNQQKGLQAFDEVLKQHSDVDLLFNAQHSLNTLSPYRRIALKHGKNYTIIDEDTNEHAYGIVVTYDHAVDIDDIFYKEPTHVKETQTPKSKPSFFEKLFGKN